MPGLRIGKLVLNRKGQLVWLLRNNSGGTVNAGATVIFDTTVTDAFTTTTVQDDPLVAGMCLQTVTNQATSEVLWLGFTDLLKVDGTTDIAKGDLLSSFTTAGIAAKRSAVTKGGLFAIALEAYTTNDGNGVIDAWVLPVGRTDASGNTLTYGTAGQMAADGVGSANAAGSTAAVSRVDHVHTNTADTPALTLGTSNAVGTAGSILAADATVALFDATVPGSITVNATAAVGSAAFAARRDHAHGFPNSAAPADGSSLASANADGSAATLSRSDHAHKAIILNDGVLVLGTTDGAATACRMEYDTGETTDALKVGVNTASRRIIICDYADMGTDTTLALAADPELVIYDNTLVGYIRMRATTAGGFIDVASGDAIALTVAATAEVSIDANGIILEAANYIQNKGAVGAARKMIVDVGGNEVVDIYANTSAVNQIQIANAATAGDPEIAATGGDANISLDLLMKGTGALVINNGTDPVEVKLMGAAAGFNSKITDVNGNELVEFYGTASAVNGITLTNSATGVVPIIGSNGTGADANIGIKILANGTGGVQIDSGTDPVRLLLMGAIDGFNSSICDVNGNELLEFYGSDLAVNQFMIQNRAAGDTLANALQLQARGGGTNIWIKIVPKGAGQLNIAPGTVGTAAAPDVVLQGDADSGFFGDTNILGFANAGAETMRTSAVNNVHIGGTAAGATQAGTKVLYFYNAGTNPSGTIASGAAIYCSAGELYTLDSGGVATLQSPHNWEHLERMGVVKSDPLAWAFHAIHNVEGEEIGVDMFAVVRAVEQLSGKRFIHTRKV